MSADSLLAAVEKVRAARAAVRILGPAHKSRVAELQRARSAQVLAESALREESLRLGIIVTVLDPEPERGEQVVCARTLKGYGDFSE
jgi:hypothetical protein